MEIVEFEQQYGVTLPREYRAFLKFAGNGGAGPDEGFQPLQKSIPAKLGKLGRDYLSTPFSLTQAMESPVDKPPFRSSVEKNGRYRGTCFLWSLDEGFDFLIVTGPCRGQVWTDRIDLAGEFRPLEANFFTWYERWLDETHLRIYERKLANPHYVIFRFPSRDRFESFLQLFRKLHADTNGPGLNDDASVYLPVVDDQARAKLRKPTQEEKAAWAHAFKQTSPITFTPITPRQPMELGDVLSSFRGYRLIMNDCVIVGDCTARLTYSDPRRLMHGAHRSVIELLEAYDFEVLETGDGRGANPHPRWHAV